ncbi:MAG: alpha/beta hydrolase [Chromatiales bacterium]|jgi:alpha-beta hydrolase superfamily lysophospholipase
MKFRLRGLAKRILMAAIYSTFGAIVVLLIVFVLHLNSRADLDIWHTADLDEEFTQESGVESFGEYLALEQRLFDQLDELVYDNILPAQRTVTNRYHRDSLSDPLRWDQNWNRSFELTSASPGGSVLLLHGMSDSPYSLRKLGEEINAAGFHVVGLRLPGNGTAPSGLLEVKWEDMAAATRLAIRHLAEKHPGQPLYIVGYSTGAALAVQYALLAQEDESLPKVERIVLLSPAIGVSPVAAFAVWQARLGHLLGLDKLSWNDLLPEYDPFKYGSFAVNAGDVVYRLTNQIQERITLLESEGKLVNFPPILAFSSVVDATVSTPALVSGLFERLPDNGHELVLFDVNREEGIEPLMKRNPDEIIREIKQDADRNFILSIVTNESPGSRLVTVVSSDAEKEIPAGSVPGMRWPDNIYSLAHVALPFSYDDPLYGADESVQSPGIHLGDLAMRGERGVLQVTAADMLRLRWNPFYDYVETRVLDFLGQ